MVTVVARRLLQLIPILFGLSVLVFVWVRALPGDPAEALLGRDRRSSPEAEASVRRLYGLDRSLPEQYLSHVKQLVRFDFGQSISTRQAVTTELRRRFPATVELTVAALVFAVGVGLPLGFSAARRWGSWFDRLSLGTCVLCVSIPVFFLGFLLKYVFAVKLGWLPSSGRLDVTRDVSHPTGLYVLDAVLTLDGAAFVDSIRHLIMPAIALGVIPMAVLARVTRAAVLDVLAEDHVVTAEAKGLTRRVINRRHVLRNAMLPVTTMVGLMAGFLLSGAVLVEVVFAWGGLGSLLQDALSSRDYPLLQGVIMLSAIVFVLVNLLADLSYAMLDPRVRVR